MRENLTRTHMSGQSLKFRRSTFIFVLGHAARIPPISNSPGGE